MVSSAVLMLSKTRSGATGKTPQKTSSSVKLTPTKKVRKIILPVEEEVVVVVVEEEEKEDNSLLSRMIKEAKKLVQYLMKETVVEGAKLITFALMVKVMEIISDAKVLMK